MSEERWIPLSARHDPERAKEFEVLQGGVPEWLRGRILEWIYETCADPTVLGGIGMNRELRKAIHLELRFEVPFLLDALPLGRYLDVIDYVLAHPPLTNLDQRLLDDLEDMLFKGGSVWRATDRGLERRVDKTLEGVAASIIRAGDRPAQYLQEAWHKAWGTPDASGAYREAVRAVEAAYEPIVAPKNARATLGTMIAGITNKPSKFQVRLQGDAPDANVERVVGMMQLLWTSQLDRHGTADESVPLNATIEQAQKPVALATTLVHLAQQGGFAR